MTTPAQMQCQFCKHWWEDVVGTGTCSAFPEEIPFEIFSGIVVHDEPFEDGQIGDTTFELTDDPAKLAAMAGG